MRLLTSHEARELYYHTTTTARRANALRPYWLLMQRKRAAGTYDSAKARKGLLPHMLEAAKDYGQEHGTGPRSGAAMFPPAVRAQVAAQLISDAEGEWSCGNDWT